MKGHAFERWVSHWFNTVTPGADCRRGLQSRSGFDCADVVHPCFWIECKRMKSVNIRAAYRQAERDASLGLFPIVVAKDDRKGPIVALGIDDFFDLIQEWIERCGVSGSVSEVIASRFWINEKKQKRARIRAALEGAKSSAPKGAIPVAFIDDIGPSTPIAVLFLEDFGEIVREWWKAGKR